MKKTETLPTFNTVDKDTHLSGRTDEHEGTPRARAHTLSVCGSDNSSPGHSLQFQ